ncbi:MAG: PPC domain-containing DNA-binding protein [Desulfomonile sp.]|jgi:predicted DNA-binding protein with PD1-like motif|nr:DNA-binding protein [Deltaproteobacteria bacterium]
MEDSFLVRLATGDDLLDAITREFAKRNIRKAGFKLIGAVTNAVLGCYDPENRKYLNKEFRGFFEIVSCGGNVSEKDGEVFVHTHIALAGEDYSCFGGHLMPGTKIYVAELEGYLIPGSPPGRVLDPSLGLALWPVE